MNEPSPHTEYLVLSRGQWDREASKEVIEPARASAYNVTNETPAQ